MGQVVDPFPLGFGPLAKIENNPRVSKNSKIKVCIRSLLITSPCLNRIPIVVISCQFK